MPSEPRPLKVVFAMRHLGSFRMYESAIRELIARGHRLHLLIDRKERVGWQKGLDELIADAPGITWSWTVRRRLHAWFELSRVVGLWLDYLRYFQPEFDTAPILRRRAADHVPLWVVRLTERWPLRTASGRAILRRVLRVIERAMPRTPEFDEALRAESPDVMLITPLVYLGSPQVETLRSAKALGIRTALCVGSWDHLSSKAVIRNVPHRVIVWNETQKDEAVTLHGIAPDQVIVTGAQCYDRWFDRQPSRERDAFVRQVGLPVDQPFLLYVCSALFWGSPSEAEFVASWIASLRASSSEVLRKIGVLVRPHPTRRAQWEGVGLSHFEGVSIFGSSPVDRDSRNDYFDSLHHAAAVVGLNTSAFLEGAIVGRPVHAVMPERFHDNQQGTLHFRYLTSVGGGLLRTARDFEAHHRELLTSLSGPADNTPFVEAFIRPGGIDVPATSVFVDAVEQIGFEPAPAPERVPAVFAVLRVMLLPLAVLAQALVRSGISRALAGGDTRTLRRPGSADRLTREVAHEHDLERKRARLQARMQERRQRAEQAKREERRRKDVLARERDARIAERAARREAVLASAHREKALRRKRREDRKREHARRKRGSLAHRIMARLGLA